jgi:SAM-dependent methyltransferase
MERFAARMLRVGRRGRALAAGVAMTAPAGPRRVDVAAAYDLGVDAYVSLWSPVILPPAQAVVAGLGLEGTPRVLDIGAGPGSLVSSILDVAPTAQVVALDASIEMLRAAADQASAVWEEAFADAGIGPLPPRRVDTGLDSPDTIDALLRGGGLAPQRIWLEMLTHRWEPATFWRLVTGTGANRARLQLADPDTRARFLATVRARLDALDLDDFVWWGEVVCAVASRPG